LSGAFFVGAPEKHLAHFMTQQNSWRTGKSASERGYGHRWQKARLTWLQEQPLCVMCKLQGRVTLAQVVDHIAPHQGNQALFWDRRNWQSLCKSHHSSTKQRLERQDALFNPNAEQTLKKDERPNFTPDGRVVW
jgi:5-methylcytosine-specific restriction protein A